MILDDLSREQLQELIQIYARNILALDGVWFQSIEQTDGMDKAMRHDCEVWKRFTEVEARRLKKFLQLPERAGLEGLEKALNLRFAAFANRQTETKKENGSLVFRVMDCRVQSARTRKNLPLHPCLPVGTNEYAYFARVIDPRIACEPVSCYPEISDPDCACAWRFYLNKA